MTELMDDDDFASTFTVQRPTGAFAADGTWAISGMEEIETIGIIQPATARELELLPEGSRLGDVISVWSRDTVRGADGKTVEPDIIVNCGKSYRVVKVDPRSPHGYTRVFAEGFIP